MTSLNLQAGLVGFIGGAVPLIPPVLLDAFPFLVDSAGDIPVRLDVVGTVTDVTINGIACTDVEQVGTDVFCQSPALAMGGPYDVQCSNSAGVSNTLAAAIRAWEPIAGITSGVASVWKPGVVNDTAGLVDVWPDQGNAALEIILSPGALPATFVDGTWPSVALNYGKYHFVWTPATASTDPVWAAAAYSLIASGGTPAGADNGGLWMEFGNLKLYNQVPTALFNQTPTWGAGAAIDITIDMVAGELTIAGALTGNGIFSFTPTGTCFTPGTLGVGIYGGGGFVLPASTISDLDNAGANDVYAQGVKRPEAVAGLFGQGDKPGIIWNRDVDGGLGTNMKLGAPIRIPVRYTRLWVSKNCIGPYEDTGSGTIFGNDILRVAGMATQHVSGQIDTYNLDSGLHFYAGSGFQDGAVRVYATAHDGNTGDLEYYMNGAQLGATLNNPFGNTRVGWSGLGNTGLGNDPFYGQMGDVIWVKDTFITPTEMQYSLQWMFGRNAARAFYPSRTASTATWTARDGATLSVIGTDVFMFNGWNNTPGFLFNGDTSRTTNEVWESSDNFVTSALLLAGDYSYSPTVIGATLDESRPCPRHMAPTCTIGSLIYMFGSDPFCGPLGYYAAGNGPGTADIWSFDGAGFTLLTDSAPWGPRVNHFLGKVGTKVYVMGGQTDINDDATALNDVWVCDMALPYSDSNWTQLANAGWTPRGLICGPMPVIDGEMYVGGGGVYGVGGVPPAGAQSHNNDVWKFNPTTLVWTEVSADGVAPWGRRRYHSFHAWKERLWVVNGVDEADLNIADIWNAKDGDWKEVTIPPWRTSHADALLPVTDEIIVGPGNGYIGQGGGAGIGTVFSISQYDVEP